MEKDHSNTLNQDKMGSISPRPSLTIDYDLYQKYLDEPDLTESQKRDFLDALWSIIVSFVDLGFGVHPLQQAAPDECGQTGIPVEFLIDEFSDMVDCDKQSKTHFNNVSDWQSGSSTEGSQK